MSVKSTVSEVVVLSLIVIVAGTLIEIRAACAGEREQPLHHVRRAGGNIRHVRLVLPAAVHETGGEGAVQNPWRVTKTTAH